MGKRRVLFGAGAVLLGVGSALISGTAIAAADAGDDTAAQPGDTPAAEAGSAAADTGTRRATTRLNAVTTAQPAAATDSAPTAEQRAGTGRAPVRSSTERTRAATNVSRLTAPEAPAAVSRPDEPAVVAQVAGPAADTPASAPAAALALGAISALGWRPGAAAVTGFPSVAPAISTRQGVATAATDPLLPGATNGVTGVQVGHSRLQIPGAFIGNTVAADWYFPTRADGTIDAQGVIWLQHGFAATNTLYSALATDLAQRTNSIVVAPTLSSIPLTFSGGCLSCSTSQQAVADVFLDPDRSALVTSAQDAGYTGDVSELLGEFVLSGHSAGGGFATATAADYVNNGSPLQDDALLGVVMFDGVSNGTFDGTFDTQVAALDDAGIPIYQIAAPAQAWNNFGATTNQLLAARPGVFNGAVLVGGSHVDSVLGVNPVIDFILQLVTGFSPAGSTAAVYNLSNGWINDLYVGATPQDPQYGLYSAANGQIITGGTAAVGLPTPFANNLSPLDTALKNLIDAIGSLFGLTPTPVVNTGDNGVTGYVKPPLSNGVTGVRTGSSTLLIPSGENGVSAFASWYFPTQADGSVQANGLIWLQHGSSRGLQVPLNLAYTGLALALAQETNSIVVAPADFGTPFDREAAAQMFLGDRAALNVSANLAGFEGTLPQTFILTGQSAGGGFATAVGANTIANGSSGDLLGVVMFDGVSRPPLFLDQLALLDDAGIPVYQIAAPPQSPGNAWGLTTEAMLAVYPDQFFGVQIDAGSHNDSLGGTDFLAFLANEIIPLLGYRPSPPGAKAAVRTFATGWINDLYAGSGPTDPFYGIYGDPNDGTYVPNQPIVMGEAGATTLPAPPPLDVPQYMGKWYEQGSVRQFFSLGLVNTTATYTLLPDGNVRVQNFGQYFGPNGPAVTIEGLAVPVNAYNTRLDVGFGGLFGPAQPSGDEPGNYWILDYAPDYSWAIVSDPNGTTGFILTRDQFISEDLYNELVARAYQLGVNRQIIPTRQFPAQVTV